LFYCYNYIVFDKRKYVIYKPDVDPSLDYGNVTVGLMSILLPQYIYTPKINRKREKFGDISRANCWK